jgi:hypothetical protein
MVKRIIAKRTSTGKFRAWGTFGPYGSTTPARVWVAQSIEDPCGPIFEDTILRLHDASGTEIEVMAGEDGLVFN